MIGTWLSETQTSGCFSDALCKPRQEKPLFVTHSQPWFHCWNVKMRGVYTTNMGFIPLLRTSRSCLAACALAKRRLTILCIGFRQTGIVCARMCVWFKPDGHPLRRLLLLCWTSGLWPMLQPLLELAAAPSLLRVRSYARTPVRRPARLYIQCNCLVKVATRSRSSAQAELSILQRF